MVDRRLGEGTPVRNRFRLPLTLLPILAGVGTAIPLWDSRGEPEFFEAGAHVIALGGIGLAIQGRFFRLKQHVSGAISDVYAIVNVVTVLISIGLGLAYAFRALAHGYSKTPDVAIVAGSLAAIVASFAVIALFGTPGIEEADE